MRITTLELPPQSLTRLTLHAGGKHHVSLLWRVASNASGEVVRSPLILHRQTTLEPPPQSSRLTLRKRRETSRSRLHKKMACNSWHDQGKSCWMSKNPGNPIKTQFHIASMAHVFNGFSELSLKIALVAENRRRLDFSRSAAPWLRQRNCLRRIRPSR